MKKTNVLILFLLIMIVQLFPSGVSAYTFNSNNDPLTYTKGSTPVYYYSIKTPENPGNGQEGYIPASAKHFQFDPTGWESLMNNTKAMKSEVWSQVWAWENQSKPSDSIMIKQRPLTWKGSVKASIDYEYQKILSENPGYIIKEAFAYPVHRERTYPVSVADALMLMARDERSRSSSVGSEIDFGFSGIDTVDQPKNGRPVWDSRALYFRTPTNDGSDGGPVIPWSFNTIDDVFDSKDADGKQPWLIGGGFWTNWANKGYESSKGLRYLVESGEFYGRAHPVLFTPGNDPYMRTMYSDSWTWYSTTKNTSNGYLYFNWHAMVHVSDTDYRFEAILVKEPPCTTCGGSTPTPPTGDLRYEYEINLQVKNIEGKTVESGTTTETPVTVYREDFSANRQAVKQEIQADINNTEQEIAALESAKATCQAQEPDADGNPPDCSSYDSDISAKQAEKAAFESEMSQLEALEAQYQSVTTPVVLRFNGSQVGAQNVTLREGQTLNLNYNWTLTGDGTIEAEINPNKNLGIDETTYSDNKLNTPIYVSTHATAMCVNPGTSSSVSGVVRTINSNGSTTVLREYATSQLVNQSRSSMRAGYGFSYEILTTYRNEDPKSNEYGAKRTEGYFPTLVNYLPYSQGAKGYVVPMDITSNSASLPPRNETKVFALPNVYVEEFSGHVFDANYTANPKHNPNENILNGGRKWYVDFEQPDGAYNYETMSFDYGVNRLNTCNKSTVEIKGSFIGDSNGNDDFVRRTVSPNQPFPGGVGWNWIGKESLLTNLQSWWNGPAESTTNLKSITIDTNKVNQIKNYNNANGLDVKLDGQFEQQVGGF